MITTLLRIYWTNLRRDRVAQLMVFVLPIAFFTVFAAVFGGRGREVTSKVQVAVVDEDRSETSGRLVRALQAEKGLRVRTRVKAGRSARDTTTVPIDRGRAERMVRDGDVPVAIVLPAGLDTSIARFDGRGVPIQLLSDPSDPVAPQLVSGLLQKVAMTATPDVMAERGVGEFERWTGGLTPHQRESVDGRLKWLRELVTRRAARSDSAASRPAGPSANSSGQDFTGLARVEVKDVVGRKEDTSLIAFYAAGIAVMFLLFSCSAGAGALLDEIDSGTLERVLSSRVGMTGLLAGKWIYLTLLGMLEISVMFLYGMLVFRLDLLRHLPGFLVMTTATAAASAGFGMFLATLCRTRAQLGGISTLVILIISAFGGSMFPRFMMSEAMQRASLFAFNSWALDGYIKVFWRDAALVDLWPQVAVLLAFLAAFLVASRLLARRWEQA